MHETKFTQLNETKIKIDFLIPQDKVVTETESVFQQIQKTAKTPGFRAGKSPIELIRKNYDSTARKEIINKLLDITLYPTLKEKKINPVGMPVVDKMEFEFNKPCSYSVTIERHPELEVKKYKGLKFKKRIKKITDKDLKKSLEELQKYNTKLVNSKLDTVTNEICVAVDYTAWSENKELKNMKAENHMIDMSEKQLLKGLSEGLTGMKIDESKDINVDHNGKKILLKTTVKGIKEKQVPPLDDEFAKELGYQTLNELKEKVKESLVKQAEQEADGKLEDEIIDSLIKSNPLEAPESLVKEQTKHLLTAAKQRMKQQGLTDNIIQSQENMLKEKVKGEAIQQVKLMYIFDAIAKQENIDVSSEEANEHQEKMIKSSPGKEKMIERYFKENSDRLISQLKTDKIFKFILDNSKIKT